MEYLWYFVAEWIEMGDLEEDEFEVIANRLEEDVIRYFLPIVAENRVLPRRLIHPLYQCANSRYGHLDGVLHDSLLEELGTMP
jgi:hypothetical protein